MTTFYFFNNAGSLLYTRSDAVEFEHYCLDMACMGVFPFRGDIPQVGQLVGWRDSEGVWEVQEIISTETECDAEQIEIKGTNLAVSELSRFMIVPNVKVDNKRMESAMNTIVGTYTAWRKGTMPAAASDDPQEQQRYRATGSFYMYLEPSADAKVLYTYKTGAYLNLIEISGEWWHMQALQGREGWVYNPVERGKLVRDGFKDDGSKNISLDEDYPNIWDLLNKCCEQTGFIIVPRILVTNGSITGRFLDVKTKSSNYNGLRFTYNTNIVNASVKYSIENMYTSMVGVGKDDLRFRDLVWETSNGFPVDKPSGISFVTLPDKQAAYGVRRGMVTFEEIDSKEKLIYRTYEYLKSMSEPKITISGTIADLYRLGYDGTPIHLYDTAHVIIDPIGMRVELTVTDLTRDLVEPEKTNAVLGSMNDSDFINILAGRKGRS